MSRSLARRSRLQSTEAVDIATGVLNTFGVSDEEVGLILANMGNGGGGGGEPQQTPENALAQVAYNYYLYTGEQEDEAAAFLQELDNAYRQSPASTFDARLLRASFKVVRAENALRSGGNGGGERMLALTQKRTGGGNGGGGNGGGDNGGNGNGKKKPTTSLSRLPARSFGTRSTVTTTRTKSRDAATLSRKKQKTEEKTKKTETKLEKKGVQIGRFTIIRQIGRGSFGVVYEASDPKCPECHVAIKVIESEKNNRDGIDPAELVEIAAQKRLSADHHPNIVPIHEILWVESDGTSSTSSYFRKSAGSPKTEEKKKKKSEGKEEKKQRKTTTTRSSRSSSEKEEEEEEEEEEDKTPSKKKKEETRLGDAVGTRRSV